MFEYIGDEARLIRRAGRPRDKLRLAAMSVRHHLAARGIALPNPGRQTDVRIHGFDLRVRANDYFILLELLGLGAYDIDLMPIGPIGAVLDLGANIGVATIFLSRRLPRATTFVCVEPSSGSFALLEHNLGRNTPNAHAINAAVTDEPTTVTIHEGARPALTSVRRAGPRSHGHQLPGMTIAQILDACGLARVDLMKLDAEGAERELFAAAHTWSDRVGAVLAEIHPPLTVESAADQLTAHGYTQLALPPSPKFTSLLLAIRSPHDPVSGN